MKVSVITKVTIKGKEIEIKSCPCCGGDSVLDSYIIDETCGHGDTYKVARSRIRCSVCGVGTSTLCNEEYPGATEEDLESLVEENIKIWNKRV